MKTITVILNTLDPVGRFIRWMILPSFALFVLFVILKLCSCIPA